MESVGVIYEQLYSGLDGIWGEEVYETGEEREMQGRSVTTRFEASGLPTRGDEGIKGIVPDSGGFAMPIVYAKTGMKVADELYLSVALLQREHPEREAFTVDEVVQRARQEGFAARPESLRAHAHGHAAANLPPGKNGRYRMVFKQEDKRIRLLRASDYVHPDRHQKFQPSLAEVPERYRGLVEWARRWSKQSNAGQSDVGGQQWLAGLHQLKGLGREIWHGVDADEYVRSLREGWE